ncbi:MAG: serine hydrolase [Terracidiphilus sp.]
MCKTTTPPRPAAQDAIRKLPPNTAAGAVIPLQSYLQKYVAKYSNELVPSTPPTLPPDVDPNAYKRVAFSILPLTDNAPSPYYGGVFDDDTDFSASLVKIAALFAAGELLAAAKAALPGAANSSAFFSSFNAALKGEIDANADDRVKHATYPASGIIGLYPKTSSILQVTGFGTSAGPSVTFTSSFNTNLSLMIVQSDDPASGVCIDRIGLGYISAVLNENGFFDKTLTPGPDNTGATGRGIWLTADYAGQTIVRIPCVNDHPDAQLTTARLMCTLMSKIRLKQLPVSDLDTNQLMQNLLNEPKTGPNHTVPWLSPSRDPGVAPQFTIIQDKIGVAGLGFIQKPNVYSEGLIIKWNDSSQIDSFNGKIDPGNTNPSSRLSGEIAVCWQNLLGDNLANFVDGIIDVLNDTISDFFDQAALS